MRVLIVLQGKFCHVPLICFGDFCLYFMQGKTIMVQ